ncbi:MAG: Gfo/Idh/MocA family oxidoreductase [Planctomycetes bacterium]|nr:Gfo/Idh/MocA family oxidoreductase [Planctomycetota bacterium]
MTMKQPRHGVIGVGFMGQVHIESLKQLVAEGVPVQLTAVADPKPERRLGNRDQVGNLDLGESPELLFDPATVLGFASPDELLAHDDIDSVSICTRTNTHVDLAIQALEAGKHVLVEKPVALRSEEVERLQAAQLRSGRVCMPAMCMRFWPGWDWLLDAIRSRRYGKVRSAAFRRLASPPAWSRDFYGDARESGGALFDMHVHDADFIVAAFGAPDDLQSCGDLNHLSSFYRYAEGPRHVVAEGGWDHSQGFPFRMRYTVIFDEATADFDMGRDPTLLLCRDGEAQPVELATETGYVGELRHFLAATRGETALSVTLGDAWQVIKLLERTRALLGG